MRPRGAYLQRAYRRDRGFGPSMLLGILLAFLILICIALGGVVLLQRSEGGALGMGGGPSGFMTARGAGDLLTRTTWILGGLLFALCLTLTILQGRLHKGSSVVDRLKIDPLSADALPAQRAPIAPATPAPGAPAKTGFEAPAAQVNAAPAQVAPAQIAPTTTQPASAKSAARPAAKPAAATAHAKPATSAPAAAAPAPLVIPPVATPPASNTSGA